MQAPKVETLAQSMAMLDPAYSEQKGLINEQMAGLGEKYEADRMKLEGTRSQMFNKINDQAVGRGAAFSGIPLDEQAQYLANEFLPGQQKLLQAEKDERMQMRSTLADINSQQSLGAVSRIDQQQSALNTWNLSQAQMEAERRENEIQRQWQAQQAEVDRQFQAQQSAAERQFTASQNAADRAASAANARAGGGITTGAAESIVQSLASSKAGGDGKVSPNAYRSLAAQAYAQGVDPASYALLMMPYINQKHRQDYTID